MEVVEEQNLQTSVNTSERGIPKSGKWWKDTSVPKVFKNQSKSIKTSWQKKMEDKNKNKQVAMLQKDIRDKKAQEKLDRAQRAKEQEERRLANERKAEIVQVIKNTNKLKKIKKKHLRTIETRDTTNL
ncbi:unnamed protein product [Auanema sp. JU1783]|nr:unnamed protein product [Auanema sp. JU1783]